jgi:hypothetical protein
MPQTRVRISPAGMVARGALFTYLTPRLAQDARLPNLSNLTKGVTSRNYARAIPALDKAIRTAMKGRMAKDADISDLADLLNALKPGMEQADAMPMQTPMQGGGGAVAPGGGDGESDDVVAKIKAYLQQEGVSPEILNNLDAFLAEAGGQQQPQQLPAAGGGNGDAGGFDEGESEMPTGGEGLEPRGGSEEDNPATDEEACPPGQDEEDDEEAEDEVIPSEQEEQLSGVEKVSSAADSKFVTRKTMAQAIRVAQDAAIKNQRLIREAERYTRAWVGDLALDAATPADVYRGALKVLGVAGVEKLHPDALRPILDVQPKPGTRQARERTSIAQDSKVGSFADRFPDAGKVTIQ